MKSDFEPWFRLLSAACIASWLAVVARGEDILSYSVPLIAPSAGPTLEPNLQTSDLLGAAFHNRTGMNEAILEAAGRLDLNGSNGITAKFDARQFSFYGPAARSNDDTASATAISGSLDYWHTVTDELTLDANAGIGVYANSNPFGRGTTRETFGLGATYQISRAFSLTLHGFGTPYNNGALYGGKIEADWAISDRWRASLAEGLIRSAPWGPANYPGFRLSYELTPSLSLYGGYAVNSVTYLADFIPNRPGIRRVGAYYEEEDVRVGATWKVGKGWRIDFGLSLPLQQTVRYFTPFR